MPSPIYVDFDDTLIHSDGLGITMTSHPRPWASEFLQRLARYGSIFILSHAELGHVVDKLPLLGSRASAAISGILARNDLQPVIDRLEDIAVSGLPFSERQRMRSRVQPIAPPGVMFDDQPVGSWFYAIKSTAIGIGPDLWIRVSPFLDPRSPDDGLRVAYEKFKREFLGIPSERHVP